MPTVASPYSREKPQFAAVCRRIQEISTLPHIAALVIQIANNPDAGARELKAAMEIDAALTTRVLRCVNSSAYGLQRKISNLQQAISYLGVNAVRNLAVTASVSHLFRKDQGCGFYSRKALWRHLVAVGICARLIALRIRSSIFEDVYLAGLLHDIGIILEDQHVHPHFVSVIESLQAEKSLVEIEIARNGFAHTTLGAEVARNWKMPNGIVDSIQHHHNSANYNGQYHESVRCVEVANYLCSAKGLSSVGMHCVAFPREGVAALGLGKSDLLVIAEDLDREMQNNQDIFQI